jgi:hypothetical protein
VDRAEGRPEEKVEEKAEDRGGDARVEGQSAAERRRDIRGKKGLSCREKFSVNDMNTPRFTL